jgi:hypothetical protein
MDVVWRIVSLTAMVDFGFGLVLERVRNVRVRSTPAGIFSTQAKCWEPH